MTTLFLAWQAHATSPDARKRAWYPIGRLDHRGEDYSFSYIRGANRAIREANFQPLLSFPDLARPYHSRTLFPLFQNRVMNERRPDLAEHLARLGLAPEDRDPFKILAVSGGERQTDALEVFPKIEVDAQGGFSCRFFAHGVRHLCPVFQERIERLQAGDVLRVTLEWDNPVGGRAIQLQTCDDYHLAGWAPRYLLDDLLTAMAERPQLAARVVRRNPSPAPPNQRLLVELSGILPMHHQLMSGEDFQPLAS